MAKSTYTGKRARTDSNHSQIINELRKYKDITVKPVASIKQFCDIVVGYNNTNYLYEIKDPKKPPSARKLTPDEKDFHNTWTGHIKIALTTEEILSDINYKHSK